MAVTATMTKNTGSVLAPGVATLQNAPKDIKKSLL